MNVYGQFAQVYDMFMKNVPYKQWADYIQTKLKAHNVPDGGLILDLACGTGTLALLMEQMGYDIIGVDSSADMLSEARNKTSSILLLRQNMLELDLFGTIDAAYSTCDAMNYLLCEDDFINVLKKVKMFLNPGGIFIFDIKSEYKYNMLGNNTYNDSAGSASYLWKNSYDKESCINEYNVRFFLSSTRFTEVHKQRAYSVNDVKTMASITGFEISEIQDNYTANVINDLSERITFTLKKQV